MRKVTPALAQFLATATSFVMADLYTLTLTGGVGPIYYSAGQTSVTVNGKLYPLGPAFTRSKTKTMTGTQVDELQVQIFPSPADTLPPATPGAMALLQAAWQGQLDGALLILERCFMPAWGATAAGTVVLFTGRISDIDCSRTGILLKCRSHLELLTIQMPRRLWQADCGHVFGGSMCQFDRNSMAVTVLANAGSTRGALGVSFTPNPASLYDQGTVISTSGVNNLQTRTIKQLSGGVITPLPTFLADPAAGDSFTILPGCDRTLQTCINVYNNSSHHGGMEFIPTPETAV